VLPVLFLAGCFSHVADHCPRCHVVPTVEPRRLPEVPPGAPALVVLVPGAFGFGTEWAETVRELARARLPFFVYWWHRPRRSPSLTAEDLRAILQAALDRSSVPELCVLSHSAGGLLASYAARGLRVPPGRRVSVHAIAAPREGTRVSHYAPDERPNTPLGLAVGGVQPDYPPPPAGVTIVEYHTNDGTTITAGGVERRYLGRHVGHNRAVPDVALPLIRALAATPRTARAAPAATPP
jgi:hypothetical protein